MKPPPQSQPRLFDIVVACDLNRGIGIGNGLPWRLAGDMKHFRDLTSTTADKNMTNAVIMGRKTWESVPAKFRPLPGRLNIVLTRNPDYQLPEQVRRASSLESVLKTAQESGIEKYFIIGGAELYEQAINHSSCDLLYLTEVQSTFECDTFFPPFAHLFSLISQSKSHQESGLEYCFKKYKRN